MSEPSVIVSLLKEGHVAENGPRGEGGIGGGGEDVEAGTPNGDNAMECTRTRHFTIVLEIRDLSSA